MKFKIVVAMVMAQLGQFGITDFSHPCYFPDFYKEIIKDVHGRTLQNIWDYDYDRLERTHNFIQTIFPCPWKGVDPDTAAITQGEIEVFLRRPELRDKVFKSFKMMAEFYGYDIIPGQPTHYIVPSSKFQARTETWALRNTHNHARIRRILCSLRILGLPNVSKEFYHALVKYVPHSYIPERWWTEWKTHAGL